MVDDLLTFGTQHKREEIFGGSAGLAGEVEVEVGFGLGLMESFLG